VGGQVAGQQHEVHPAGQAAEGRRHPLAIGLATAVHVARGGDPHPAFLWPLGRTAVARDRHRRGGTRSGG
jgi:hypothetical protein